MLRVGLTGGIGAGKSEVSRRLAGQGAVLIDADAIAREVVEPGTTGIRQVAQRFGATVVKPDGALDRDRLGEIVFADQAELAALNEIVHPLVGERMAELESSAATDAIVVHDVPLIAENNLAAGYDLVVVVDAPPALQLDRLVRLRGLTKEQAEARMAAQASREQRLAIADFVIDNSSSLAELDRQVGDLWMELRRRARTDVPRRAARTPRQPRTAREARHARQPRGPRQSGTPSQVESGGQHNDES
jgi:dephospho-CoA kinase